MDGINDKNNCAIPCMQTPLAVGVLAGLCVLMLHTLQHTYVLQLHIHTHAMHAIYSASIAHNIKYTVTHVFYGLHFAHAVPKGRLKFNTFVRTAMRIPAMLQPVRASSMCIIYVHVCTCADFCLWLINVNQEYAFALVHMFCIDGGIPPRRAHFVNGTKTEQSVYHDRPLKM